MNDENRAEASGRAMLRNLVAWLCLAVGLIALLQSDFVNGGIFVSIAAVNFALGNPPDPWRGIPAWRQAIVLSCSSLAAGLVIHYAIS